MREQSLENLQKSKIKSKYLKKISQVSITIDLFSFTIMEIFKLIYHDEGLFANEFLFFIAKVRNCNNNNLGFNSFESVGNHVLFHK